MGILSEGQYGMTEGIFFSFPMESSGNEFNVIKGLELDELSISYIKKSENELIAEREIIKSILMKN